MLAQRIDNFAGDDRAYAGYLLDLLSQNLPNCICWLEKQVKEIRKQVKEIRRSSNPLPTQTVLDFRPSATSSNAVETPSPSGNSRMYSFFENLPKTEDEWYEKRKSASLLNESDILSTARCLATAQFSSIPFTDHTKEVDLQDSLVSFAKNVGEALAKAKSYSNTSHFLSLIFVATCCVAITQGHKTSLVDDAQRKLIEVSRAKCNKGGPQLTNDRAAVKWLLQEMQRQFHRGLRQRAFELFFLSMLRSILPGTSHSSLPYRR